MGAPAGIRSLQQPADQADQDWDQVAGRVVVLYGPLEVGEVGMHSLGPLHPLGGRLGEERTARLLSFPSLGGLEEEGEA